MKKLTDEQRAMVIEGFFKYKISVISIAKVYGVTRWTIYKILNSAGTQLPRKIKPTDIADIIKEYQINGTPVSKIAKNYGVTRGYIYHILTNNAVSTCRKTERQLLVKCSCGCGKEFKKYRSKIYESGRNFYNTTHFSRWLNNSDGEFKDSLRAAALRRREEIAEFL